MDYITVTTPDNIEIQYRLAGLGSRMAAVVIDTIIQIFAFTIIIIALLLIFFNEDISQALYYDFNGWAIAFVIILFFVIFFGYFIISELSMNGQSIGKKIFKLRVIKENGQPIHFGQSVVRNLFRYFIDIYGVGVLTVFFSKKCKRTGDMVASTIVIAENPQQIKSETLTISDLVNNQPYVLTDYTYKISKEEYYLLKDYFSRKDAFIDKGQKVKDRLAAYFAAKTEVPLEKMDEEALYQLMRIHSGRHSYF